MSESLKTILSLMGMILVVCGLGVAVAFSPEGFTVIVSTNTNYDDWLEEFRGRVMLVGSISLVTSLLWYLSTRFYYKITSPADTGRRFTWCCWFGVSLILSALGVLLWDSQIQEGKMGVYVMLCLYAMVGYYLPTVYFTPSAYKYAPIGAELLRAPSKRRRGV